MKNLNIRGQDKTKNPISYHVCSELNYLNELNLCHIYFGLCFPFYFVYSDKNIYHVSIFRLR